MTIISHQYGVQDGVVLVKVELDDGSSLYIKDCYLEGYFKVPFSKWDFLQTGGNLSSEEEEVLRFADSCFRAERTGRRLISRAEQTQTGLSLKLKKRGHDNACISIVLSRFLENNLINDERYAERWLRSQLFRKSGNVKGPRQLSAALLNRGISREVLKEVFNKVLDEEAEFTLLQRFLMKNKAKIATTSADAAYYLRNRLRHEGFTAPIINRYFDEA